MRKINLDLLMNGVFNQAKDQVLVHAVSELKGIPFNPAFAGLRSSDIAHKAHKLCPASRLTTNAIMSVGGCSVYVRSIVSSLIDSGEITKSELEDKISVLMETVYTDPRYIHAVTFLS